ncbi:hypothetical protein RUM43_004552 [Polyplax serrata]|uniref:WDR13 n=1 Tax=Polyplax serrata TaxID=468196 RepID=A0AAN8SBV4_POLSC
MASLWQQVLAVDARCNAYRSPNNSSFRAMYIRRRSQLLKEAFKGSNLSFRKQYLKIRALLLQQYFGINNALAPAFDQISLRSKSNKTPSKTNTAPHRVSAQGNSLVPTKHAEASCALVGGTSISENYAFVGVHHIYDQHIASVVSVKFAPNDRSKLCCASSDGTLSICTVTSKPPTVDMLLREHEKAVTGFDWSLSNDSIVSCSLDCTVRLWDSSTGKCLRVFHDEFNSEAGNSKGVVYVLNVSAGIHLKGGSNKIGGRILSLACDSLGMNFWAGNDKGIITSFLCQLDTGKLQKKRKIVIADNCPITCLSWKTWISREARDPSLLVNCAANVLCLFRVDDIDGNLKLKKKFNIRHKSELLRSTFCPITSFRQGACVGSEDSCVYFLDVEKEEKAVVNKLQGHSCPVLGVSFNYDESLLATSDVQGLVIVWKRGR